jgi:NAD(P)H dehydrogenase (quinone)
MAKILVVFHSWTGNVYRLAEAVAAGARSVEGCTVDLKQVPDPALPDGLLGALRDKVVAARKSFAHVLVAAADSLPGYDGIAFGTPTRLGTMTPAMRSFLDQTGNFYLTGALAGKPATVFCSTSSGGGQETTITSFWNTLAHLGMTIMPLGYRDLTITDLTEARGGGPYGAAALSKGEGERPSPKEKAIAQTQGRILAEIALKLTR